MGKKRLLTLEDLYDYCVAFSSNPPSVATSNILHFSAKKDDEVITVQMPGKMNFKGTAEYDDKEGLLAVELQSCHIGRNAKGSNIDKSVMETALPSFSNRPILGYIHEVDGKQEFYAHNMHLDDDGEIIYDEIPVGIIPESCNARLEEDKEKGETYCVVNGYIFEEYTAAADILRRENECSVSVELSIREMSFNAKEQVLNVENFYFSGVTILGKDDEGKVVKPGMKGANIKLTNDFSLLNMEGKGVKQVNRFSELLERYGKKKEEIKFDYEGLNDEELEKKFVEEFGEIDDTDETDGETDEGNIDESDEGSGEGTNEGSDEEPDEGSGDKLKGEGTEGETIEGEIDTTLGNEGKNHEADKQEEKFTKVFELSHDDIRSGLYALLSSYEENDDDWYLITAVYNDYFIYESWFNENVIYGQKYMVDGDNVAFDGERYTLHREYLTDSEYNELQTMRSNYAALQAEVTKYRSIEENERKDGLFSSDEYKLLHNTEAFEEIKKSMDKMSFEELKGKLDEMLLNFVKSNNSATLGALNNAQENGKKQATKIGLSIRQNKRNRYGSIFSRQ